MHSVSLLRVFGLVIGVAAALISGCERVEQGTSVSVLDTIRDEGRIRAAYIVYPPFVTKDPNTAELGGLFIDAMGEVARQMDVEIEYTEAKWSNMVTGLKTNAFDVVVSGIFPTIPRAQEVGFVRPLMYVGLGGVVRTGDDRFVTDADLDRDGIKVAVINGEVGQEYMRLNHPDTELIVLNTADIGRAAEEVRVGRADIALTDGLTCFNYVQQFPDETRLVYADDPFYVFGVTVMVRRADVEWKQFLDTSFELLQNSGYISRLEDQYRTSEQMWRSRSRAWD